MYVSVRRYKTDPGSVDELLRRVEEGFVPILSGVPGFKGYYAVDAGDGDLAFINIFEDQAGADESNARAATYVAEHLAPLLPTPPQITAGQVRIHASA